MKEKFVVVHGDPIRVIVGDKLHDMLFQTAFIIQNLLGVYSTHVVQDDVELVPRKGLGRR